MFEKPKVDLGVEFVGVRFGEPGNPAGDDRVLVVISEPQVSGYSSILDSSACLIEAGISVDLRVFGSKNTSTVS